MSVAWWAGSATMTCGESSDAVLSEGVIGVLHEGRWAEPCPHHCQPTLSRAHECSQTRKSSAARVADPQPPDTRHDLSEPCPILKNDNLPDVQAADVLHGGACLPCVPRSRLPRSLLVHGLAYCTLTHLQLTVSLLASNLRCPCHPTPRCPFVHRRILIGSWCQEPV